jgi:hypothetical protein
MIIFAGIQILLSQLPNFHKLWWLSIVAAVMSLAYSSIGLGLSIAKIAGKLIVFTLSVTDNDESCIIASSYQPAICIGYHQLYPPPYA